jgi:hypothetical protein
LVASSTSGRFRASYISIRVCAGRGLVRWVKLDLRGGDAALAGVAVAPVSRRTWFYTTHGATSGDGVQARGTRSGMRVSRLCNVWKTS